eukprot:NODE_4156_length_1107_cov_87.628049_g3959_i0.p1 GENE.NODE_4156_length_1107_cov_87.628049_g3959_i0~~NODE_4156_length_1107_cov_87.628049_g3959_i0.p1  ORF type:complete len:302 (-),score=33.83 NODE_4156_length_1107_cov_87.628049_g3959_i0:129-1034(-)
MTAQPLSVNPPQEESNSGVGDKPVDIPSIQKDRFTILHMSDTHRFIRPSMVLPDADVLIHSGDFSVDGTIEEYEEFDAWLASKAAQFPTRIVVLGNHDVREFKDDFPTMRSLLPHATHVPIFEEVHLHGARLFGAPWHWFQNWKYAFKAGCKDMKTRFDQIPTGLDILVTHGPSRGLLDLAHRRYTSGSEELRRHLAVARPRVHLHGHIHEQYGTHAGQDGTHMVVNAAMSDEQTRFLENGPILIDAIRIKGRWTFTPRTLPPLRDALPGKLQIAARWPPSTSPPPPTELPCSDGNIVVVP